MTRIPESILKKVRRPKSRFKGRHAVMTVSRNFMRNTGKEMSPLTFRIMCHGLTYPRGWSVRRCVNETGYSRNVIYRHLQILINSGYVIKVKHPTKNNVWGYRFTAEPGKPNNSEEELND